MALVKLGQVVADEWRHLADDEAVPEDGAITVSWQRWLTEFGGSNRPAEMLGVRVPNTVPGAEIGPDAARFSLIVLSFPNFGDGRAYSQARVLRERYGFKGELRATGGVLRDQLQFMQRCGIDAFELGERAIAENWLDAFEEFDLFYQPAADNRPWIARQRSTSQPK
jgi:uncharacterized protein (DUF934 family)